ncbi:glutathione S-transferase [Allostella sp. ATCC 35155]|nr:glutathione S-transferase [Stella sp. ATCC 35155]
MRMLHHFWLSAASRKVRIALREKDIPFETTLEKPWERRPELLALNPAGEVPVLVEQQGIVLSDGQAICEFLEEVYPQRPLLPRDVRARAEVRRLVGWFDGKFSREVTDALVGEKMIKRLTRRDTPNSALIRLGLAQIRFHLDYIGELAERRRWLGGDEFSLADITAAAHLSAVDYIGDVPWADCEPAKDWYARIKSRPSFRPILADHVPGAPPPAHYADLDF